MVNHIDKHGKQFSGLVSNQEYLLLSRENNSQRKVIPDAMLNIRVETKRYTAICLRIFNISIIFFPFFFLFWRNSISS